jgi:hypothetical protein
MIRYSVQYADPNHHLTFYLCENEDIGSRIHVGDGILNSYNSLIIDCDKLYANLY